jgi:hypothetical protein
MTSPFVMELLVLALGLGVLLVLLIVGLILMLR